MSTKYSRRQMMHSIGAVGAAGLMSPLMVRAAAQLAQRGPAPAGPIITDPGPARGVPSPKIQDLSVINVQVSPRSARLSVVKITTDQPGLYGYGCATFTQRADLIQPAVDLYLKPLLVGRPTDGIQDIWQLCWNSGYWRIGPVLNNAISGVDEALWDIKGRKLGVPVYELVGGKARDAAEVYRHASGATFPELVESIQKLAATGCRNCHIGIGGRGQEAAIANGAQPAAPDPMKYGIGNLQNSDPNFDPVAHARQALDAFEYCRKHLGDSIGLGYDAHERLASARAAVQFCKDAEQYRPYMIEDPLAPEDIEYYKDIRQACTTPIAMGELFNNPNDWQFLITNRLIDYIRCHVSQIGGFSQGLKIANLGEMFEVRTAWHNPGDTSPVGIMANLTLDVTSRAFGIQEFGDTPTGPLAEIFQGAAEYKDGYAWVSNKPGWGIEVDEKVAAKYPFNASQSLNGGWGALRRPDGSITRQ